MRESSRATGWESREKRQIRFCFWGKRDWSFWTWGKGEEDIASSQDNLRKGIYDRAKAGNGLNLGETQ